MANKQFDMAVFAAMHEGKPLGAYRKTVLCRVFVDVLDVFSGEPKAVELYGDPKGEDAMVYVFSLPEDIYFKRQNRKLFEQGYIIPVAVPAEEPLPVEVPLEQSSDDEVKKIVNSNYKAMTAILNKTESEAFVNRLLVMAEEEEKSERFINAIRNRLVEIQSKQFKQFEQEDK